MNDKKKVAFLGFVTVVMGMILVFGISFLRNSIPSSSQEKYQMHEQAVHKAVKKYTKNYQEAFRNGTASCFDVPYQALIDEKLLEEDGISCSGSVILRKKNSDGYRYEYDLNCYDETGKMIHESEPIPLFCEEVSQVEYAYSERENEFKSVTQKNLKSISMVTNQTLRACTPTALTSGTPGTAKAEEILTGTEAWVNGKKVTGAMKNYQGVKETLKPGDSYTIPKGYHDGTGTVSASSLASNTNATAGSEDILDGKTAWVSGKLVKGTMTNNGSVKQSLDPGKSYTISKGYHDGTGVITATTLKANTSANAGEGDILKGETAWVNGTKVTGTMPNREKLNWKPTTSTTFEVPAGYYSGGTLDSSAVYEAGYQQGHTDGVNRTEIRRVKLGSCSSSCSYSLTSYPGYSFFSNNNFGMIVTGISLKTGYWNQVGDLVNQGPSHSYNASTGALSVQTARRGVEQSEKDWANVRGQANVSVDVYLYY